MKLCGLEVAQEMYIFVILFEIVRKKLCVNAGEIITSHMNMQINRNQRNLTARNP